nr:MAG TPA: hypothetical protein [Caudoviricetes sp.]
MEKLNYDDIRKYNVFQESGRVFIHLKDDNRTICRIMSSHDCVLINKTSSRDALEAKKLVASLLNEKYFEPQKFEKVQLTAAQEASLQNDFFRSITGCDDPELEWAKNSEYDY